MQRREQETLVQDYVNLLGKTYIILLSTLDDFFGAPLSTNEKVVLQVLDDEPISIKEVSMRTGLALSTLTNVLDKMERKRLVMRRHCQADRRMVNIELEEAGLALKAKFNELIRTISSTAMEILSAEDRKNFANTLEKTAGVLSAENNTFQEVLGSLIEPMKLTIATELKKK